MYYILKLREEGYASYEDFEDDVRSLTKALCPILHLFHFCYQIDAVFS